MNKYILVLNGSRGMIENVEVRESELNIEDFCNELYKKVLNEVYKNVDEDEKESVDKYVEEFGLVSDMRDGSWEVGVSDEEWYSVWKVDLKK
jgi:hypothetical protein